VVALAPPSGVALVLSQAFRRLLRERRVHYGRDCALYDLGATVEFDNARARIRSLLDDLSDSRVPPPCAVLARLAPVAIARGPGAVTPALPSFSLAP
jgi:hypothetical protein